jgi:cobalt/nickel transport system permease protein
LNELRQDRNSHQNTVGETDARIKVSLAVFAILVTSLIPVGQWWIYLCLWVLTSVLGIVLRIDIFKLFKRSLLVLPFCISTIPLVFRSPADFWLPVENWMPGINLVGLYQALSIIIKSIISVQIAALLIMTTPFGAIMAALRAFGIPKVLISVMTMMWHYLEVILDEARRMMQARAARSACLAMDDRKIGGNLFFRATVTGGMAGSLFIRSLERSERVYQAMLARGYDGDPREDRMGEIPSISRSIGIIGFSLLAGILFLAYWLR